jgi:uncharacterized protein YbjQ (UPF0145 family)
MFVTTTNDINGYKIVRYLGVVRGITVRSRNVLMSSLASWHTLFGGKITAYTTLAEHSRQEAFDELCLHAEQVGANAVVAMRYESNEITPGVTEVLAYGTAVVVEQVPNQA